MCVQVRAFEPVVQAAMPHKSKLAFAEQLLAMLAASKQINKRIDPGQGLASGLGLAVPSISSAPQVRWLFRVTSRYDHG